MNKKRGNGRQPVFRFKPFSDKQKRVMTWWMPSSPDRCRDGIIADGSVRSGKTVSMSLGFVLWAMNSFSSENFAICGKTHGSVERNVLTALRPMLLQRGYRINESRSEHTLTVSGNGISNRFYCFGGNDESSQDHIQGMTLAGAFFDEAVLMPESFVNQATARCSVSGSKWWFNCNPAGPYHWFKKSYIDRASEKNLLYIHFSMEDNLSLSPEIIKRYESMYTGVFYRRYVLGEWCAAEGLVYPMFDPDIHIGQPDGTVIRYFLSCDYGTHNPFALGLFSVRAGAGGQYYCLEREYYHDGRKNGQLTDSQYAGKVSELCGDIIPDHLTADPSASSFITEMRGRGMKVIKAANDVAEGIRCVADTLTDGRLLIRPCCTDTIREFSSYIWDDKAAEKGEDRPLKVNDHAMDMIRYALYTDKRGRQRKDRYSGRGRI